MIVYLAGPITADPATHAWRATVSERLRQRGHTPLNPLRGKDVKTISDDGLTSSTPGTLFVARDEADICMADVMLVNTLGVEALGRQSIGTWAEIGLARARRIPIVMIAIHSSVIGHPFVKAWAAAVVPTLREGLNTVLWLAGDPDMW